MAGQPRLAGAGSGGRDRRRGVPGGGQPADRGHGGADPFRRRHHPGRHGGHRLRVLRHRVPRHIRCLPARGPARPDLAEADQLPRPHPRRRAHVRPGAVGAGRGRAGGLLAAAQRLAARGAVARQRRAGAGRGAEDRYPHLRAVRADLARGPAVRHHAVHLVRADPRDGRVPRSRPAHHARGAARRAARRRGGRLAAPPGGRAADPGAHPRRSGGWLGGQPRRRHDAHRAAGPGPAHRRGPLGLDRGGRPVRRPRRGAACPGGRHLRSRGAGAGDRRRAPARGGLPVPAAGRGR